MTFLLPPAAPAPPSGAFAVLLIDVSQSIGYIQESYTNTLPHTLYVVTGIDCTVVGGSASEYQATYATLTGSAFYHDSQSVGQGGGITFSWRGALPLGLNAGFSAQILGGSDGLQSVVAWGWAQPY